MLILNVLFVEPLIKANESLVAALKRANQYPDDDMLRDACILRFEFTFELVWKTLKRILMYRGLDHNSPRQVFRYAAKEQLLKNPETWFDFLEKRNRTTHTYNHETAKEIFAALADFSKETHDVLETIKVL